jgi:hypothetical protein
MRTGMMKREVMALMRKSRPRQMRSVVLLCRKRS